MKNWIILFICCVSLFSCVSNKKKTSNNLLLTCNILSPNPSHEWIKINLYSEGYLKFKAIGSNHILFHQQYSEDSIPVSNSFMNDIKNKIDRIKKTKPLVLHEKDTSWCCNLIIGSREDYFDLGISKESPQKELVRALIYTHDDLRNKKFH